LAKQYAAPNVGVLHGIPGVTTPIYAIPKHIIPSENQIAFLTLSVIDIIDPFDYLMDLSRLDKFTS
jgi:hypothetical protein